jgi:hypothetical protein
MNSAGTSPHTRTCTKLPLHSIRRYTGLCGVLVRVSRDVFVSTVKVTDISHMRPKSCHLLPCLPSLPLPHFLICHRRVLVT